MNPTDAKVRDMLRLKCRSRESFALYERVLDSVGDLTRANVSLWWQTLNSNGLGDSSIRLYHGVLRSCLRYLAEEGDKDAAQALRFLRTVNVPVGDVSSLLRKPLTDKERDCIHAALPERYQICATLIRYSGVRISTALAVSRENILEQDGGFFLSIRGKGNRLFEWPLPDALARTLLNLSEPWFPFTRFDFYRRLRRAAEEQIGRSCSPHDLRRAFAHRIWSRTHDTLFLARSLHHASVQTSMRYVLHDESRAREVLKSL